MINSERIVPVQATDLISLYGLILLQNSSNSGLTAIDAGNPGEFTMTTGSIVLASEPVKSFDIDDSISSATIYFVPAYDYAGFKIDGAAASQSGDVEADGRTLYKAVLATNAITITKAGF